MICYTEMKAPRCDNNPTTQYMNIVRSFIDIILLLDDEKMYSTIDTIQECGVTQVPVLGL